MRAASSARVITLIHRIRRAEAERDRLAPEPDDPRYQRAAALVQSIREELATLPLDSRKSAKRETREQLLRELIEEVRSLKVQHAGSPGTGLASSEES
jgi:hypothetical protein